MKIRKQQARLVGDAISRTLLNSGLVTMTQGTEAVSKVAQDCIIENIDWEMAIDAEVEDILEKQDDEISFYQADRRQLFWMIKKRLCEEEGFSVDKEERYNNLSHDILDELYEEDLINYAVSENRIKNLILKAIFDYGRSQDKIEDRVHDKISKYKRPIKKGTEEYEILFEKFYEEEIGKLGN